MRILIALYSHQCILLSVIVMLPILLDVLCSTLFIHCSLLILTVSFMIAIKIYFMHIFSLKTKWCPLLNMSQVGTLENAIGGENIHHSKGLVICRRESTDLSLLLGFSFLHLYQHFHHWNQGHTLMRRNKTMWGKSAMPDIHYFTEQKRLARDCSSFTKAKDSGLTWR